MALAVALLLRYALSLQTMQKALDAQKGRALTKERIEFCQYS